MRKITNKNRNLLLNYLESGLSSEGACGMGIHMWGFDVDLKNKFIMIKDSLLILKELVNICSKNSLLNNFLPRLTFFLKNIKHLGDLKRIYNYEDLIDELDDNVLPEICLDQKIFYTNNINIEKYEYPVYRTAFSELVPRPKIFFNDNYYFIHSFIRSEDNIKEMTGYNVSLDIVYNENNSETVSNIKRLSLRQ